MTVYRYLFNFTKNTLEKTIFDDVYPIRKGFKQVVLVGNTCIDIKKIDNPPNKINFAIYLSEEHDEEVNTFYLDYVEKRKEQLNKELQRLDKMKDSILGGNHYEK